MQTRPPGTYVVLYDGHCRFCVAGAKKLVRLARPGAVEAVDFQAASSLDRFPGITYEACMQAMHLVAPDGRVYRGFEAAVRAVCTRRLLGMLARIYYVPGFRQLCDWLYARVAARRYRILGRTCPDGTCSLHAGEPKPYKKEEAERT
jgi:predicted DCC family thiol-disulfide oxidoreductase YuxK